MYRKLHPGDVVRVKPFSKIKSEFKSAGNSFVGPCALGFLYEMTKLCAQKVTIVDMQAKDIYYISESNFSWSADMFEGMGDESEGNYVSIW